MTKQRAKIAGIARHRLSTDGDGVTTLVVMHGCPLGCRYCLNPQTIAAAVSVSIRRSSFMPTRIDELYFLATNGGVTFGGGEPGMHPCLIREFRKLCRPLVAD